MHYSWFKRLLPASPLLLPVLRGPFRGARVMMVPRDSLRKVFGFYEHELNLWLNTALRKSHHVIDVGANDGYFTFGCAAAFRRLRKSGFIVALEPEMQAYEQLLESKAAWDRNSCVSVTISLVRACVGALDQGDTITLDSLLRRSGTDLKAVGTLLKIDVEGAELDVLRGAGRWLNSSNLFVIEVHNPRDVEIIRERFRRVGLATQHVPQRSLPFIGGENRAAEISWIVSRL